MNFVVVGAGGIGSSLAEPLARYLEYGVRGNHLLILVDGDAVEDKNRERQNFSVDDIGANKAQVLAEELVSKGFNEVEFAVVEEYVNKSNIKDIIEDGAIVLSCVDNHNTRNLLSRWIEENLPNSILISGGNELRTGNVQAFVRHDGVNVTGNLFENHAEIENPEDKHPDEISCSELVEQGGEAAEQTIMANLFASTLMLNLLGELMTWKRDPLGFDGHLTQEVVFNINGSTQAVVKKDPKQAMNGKEAKVA
jgi:molybdopterin/thiamine biosynthesis adenylyltransferase